ncbi:MAG: glycosyltransferase [Actinomycetota bacterium]|nr:glycosyltransferase [Actinomycetota bacterium]
MTEQPWLSVITVVKDDPPGMRRSIESLVAQDLDGVEYIVNDGSADRDAVPSQLAGVDHRYAWSPPLGIYPAMNAALASATGDYVYFLNAGDAFHSADVLQRVRTALHGQPTWAFGEVEIVQRDGARVVTPRWDYAREKAAQFSNGRFPPHQGTFARRAALLKFGGFDPRYSIVADYVAFLRLGRDADPLYLDLVVATFTEGGISTTRWPESLRQFHRARREVLRPRGWDAAREYAGTARQAVAMSVYRGVVSRFRRP